ncbi:MAG: hypothetical protein ACREJ3_01480, partial [Polyangiaceae bacterium]
MLAVVLRVLSALVGRLSWGALGPLGGIVGWLAGSVLRIRRAHVEGAMRAAGIGDAARQARAMYRSLGVSAMEILWLAKRGTAAVDHVAIDPGSSGPWQRAIGLRRGVVIAVSHTGNWDLAACATAGSIELCVVTKRLSVRSLDRFWQSTRARQGIELVDPQGALSTGRVALARGAAV